MRIDKNPPRRGDRRSIRRFMFLPLTINGIFYWLEMVTLQQVYSVRILPNVSSYNGGNIKREWKTISVY